jgi:peptidoglycan/xylan/chitin deacetylase (PgdA/CDA1 family)
VPHRAAPPQVRKKAWITTTAKRARGHAKTTRRAHANRDAVPGEPVYYVDRGPKVIALTIDDGPSPVYTPQILRILERYRVTASFSMIGESVACYPGIARDVADAGHVIVNHTWDHADLAWLGAAATRADMRNTRTGSIILEHDGGGDRSQTVAALRTAIPRLLDEGYRFATP